MKCKQYKKKRKKLPNKPDRIAEKVLRYNPDLPNGGYTDSQLHERIRGAQFAREFGIPNETLQNYREKTKDTDVLHGPESFVDGDINLYYRKDGVKFCKQHEWRNKTSDTFDTSDEKVKLHIFHQKKKNLSS